MPIVTEPFAIVIEGRGPRAVERLLLTELARRMPRSADDLEPPLRVVVPSSSLRLHLGRVIVREHGAVAGVLIQSLFSVAAEILERVGHAPPSGDMEFEIIARRIAAREPDLHSDLEDMDDGYGAAVGAVRDLLDAGLGRVQMDAVLEKLDELDGRLSPGRLRRARAVVRVAGAVGGELDRLDLVRRAGAPGLAADLLLDHGPAVLPARAVLIVGFADATGVATELIQALLSRIGGALLLDRPPDPVDATRDDAGCVFLDRLSGHLGGLGRKMDLDTPEPPAVVGLEGAGADASIRGVAHRIRALLDDGAEPESIGVVSRETSYLAVPIRRHFARLAIPFSGGGSTVGGGAVQRRSRLLASLLAAGADTPAELWIECAATRDTDLLLALRTLGVVRLEDVAGLGTERDYPNGVRLPMHAAADDGEGRRHRRLPASRVAEARRAARRLTGALRRWPRRAKPAAHLAACREVLSALGWDRGGTVEDKAGQALALLASQLSPEEPLTFDEWLLVVGLSLDTLGAEAVGGSGGGIQVLSAIEARGRTFDHVFIVGLDRGVFPRVVEDDPMLPDQARGHLASDVLPDTPVKARGLDEERYLFAQLLASAPRVTLCWGSSAVAASRVRSAFVEGYDRQHDLQTIHAPDPSWLAGAEDPYEPRPAVEHAVLAARAAGSRWSRIRPYLELAVREGRDRAEGLDGPAADETAAARLDVLAETDPPRGTATPGPWAGLVAAADPGELPWVTGLEGIATCPFQMLLTRRLGVAPMPDPRLGLPDTGGSLVGELVHAVLERVVEVQTDNRRGLDLWDLLDADPVEVRWPTPEALGSMLSEAARRIVRERGLAGWGLEPLLAAQATACLEVARRIDWRDGVAHGVLAAEVRGELTVAGLEMPLRFRADRLDRGPEGLLLVDYKTGRPISIRVREATRREHLARTVACGGALQTVAYALAVPGIPAAGRYVFLKPDIGGAPEEARDVRVRDDETDIIEAFNNAVAVVAAVWATGACVPRVVEPGASGTPSHCRWCDVSEACRRDDSDYSRRIGAWIDACAERANVRDSSARARAAVDLWWLGRARPEDGG
jgi:hypothetical protein